MTYTQLDLFEPVEKPQTIADRIAQYGVKGLADNELITELIRPYLSSRADARKTAQEILASILVWRATASRLVKVSRVTLGLIRGFACNLNALSMLSTYFLLGM